MLKRVIIPYVNIRITGGQQPGTAEQKATLIKGITDLLAEVITRGPKTFLAIIDEIDTDNYGISGETITVHRRQCL
jgi:4-oxalocrotonate tautomerase